MSRATTFRPTLGDAAREAVLKRARAETDSYEMDESTSLLRAAAKEVYRLATEQRLDRSAADDLVRDVAREAGLEPDVAGMIVHLKALREAALLWSGPTESLSVQLTLLTALAPIESSSVWEKTEAGAVLCAARRGSGPDDVAHRRAAVATLNRTVPEEGVREGNIIGLAVPAGGDSRAALIVFADEGRTDHAYTAATAALSGLGQVLERKRLLDLNHAKEQALVASSERRLSRLGLDLHDGAIQDLAVLAADIRLLKRQVADLVHETEHAAVAIGRFDDLEARVGSIDDDLRELARSYQTSRITNRPLTEVIGRTLRAFEGRTRIRTSLEVDGDFMAMTDSQRIALVRSVQEALTNIRQHSGASDVRVRIEEANGAVRAEVIDDGCGFLVEPTLIRAAKHGRLGLVGMAERVRLLGGTFEVDSRPGGPTRIAVVLPEWQLDDEGPVRLDEIPRAG